MRQLISFSGSESWHVCGPVWPQLLSARVLSASADVTECPDLLSAGC